MIIICSLSVEFFEGLLIKVSKLLICTLWLRFSSENFRSNHIYFNCVVLPFCYHTILLRPYWFEIKHIWFMIYYISVTVWYINFCSINHVRTHDAIRKNFSLSCRLLKETVFQKLNVRIFVANILLGIKRYMCSAIHWIWLFVVHLVVYHLLKLLPHFWDHVSILLWTILSNLFVVCCFHSMNVQTLWNQYSMLCHVGGNQNSLQIWLRIL